MIKIWVERQEIIEAEWIEALELGRVMLTEYLKEYGKDEQWDFIATEKSGRVTIPPMDGSQAVLYAYTYDGVYRDLADGDIKLLETKTAAAISTGHLSLDDQAGSYWATASAQLRKEGSLEAGQRIAGINYNFLRKSLPDTRPRHPVSGERCNKPTKAHYAEALKSFFDESDLKKMKLDELASEAERLGVPVYGEVSASQPTPNFLRHMVRRSAAERNTQIRRIAQESQWMQAVRDGVLPIIKSPVSTGSSACQYGCEFFNMCELQEAGADWEQYRDRMYKVEDPYSDHRKSAHTDS